METQNHPRSRYAGKALLIGTALTVALVAPLAGSAALDGGGFFIYAYNDQEPEIDARAGLNGLASNPGGENPGGENPGNSLASTVVCGDQTVTVTQAMLDFSDKNREAVSSGGTAETWPGGDWKFITAGSYWEAISGTPVPAGFEAKKDRAYILSTDPAGASIPQLVNEEVPLLRDQATNTQVADINSAAFSSANGSTPSVIGAFVLSDGNNDYSSCSYSKFENGKISSSDGSPAYYVEGIDGSKRTLYAKAGLPAFGPEKASYSVRYSADIVVDSFYHGSNGERWDYNRTKGSIWHPDRAVQRSETTGEVAGETRWTNCFGDSCEIRIETPTVEFKETKINEGDAVRMTNYAAPRVINGANSIMAKYRANGTLKTSEYSNTALNGAPSENGQPRWAFSRTDGPAMFSEDETGKVYSREYYVDGYAKQNQTQYETAGGTGWLGMYSGGKELEYLGD